MSVDLFVYDDIELDNLEPQCRVENIPRFDASTVWILT